MIFNEKRFCILLLVGLAAALACGARGTKRKTEKPAVLLQVASDFQLQGLSLKKKATVVELEYVSPYYYNPENTKMTFFRRAFLVQEGDTLALLGGEVAHAERGERLPFCPDSTYLPLRQTLEGKLVPEFNRLTLRFPALPQPKKTFTLVLERAYGSERFVGIRTDGQGYRAALPPAAPSPADRSLPTLPTRGGHAVLTGRVVGFERNAIDYQFWGNSASFTNDAWDFSFEMDKETGTFRADFDLLYPIRFSGQVPQGVPFNVLLLPGDSLHLDIDVYAFAELRARGVDTGLAALQCVQRTGGCRLADEWRVKKGKWGDATCAYQLDNCQAHLADDFATYARLKWAEHCRRLEELKELELTDDERRFLRLFSEHVYLVCRNQNFLSTKKFAHEPPDSAALAEFEAQIDLHDPHAAELLLPHTLQGLLLVNNDQHLDYFEANGLGGAELAQWEARFREARRVMKRISLFHPLRTEAEWAAIDPLYRPALREINRQVEEVLREQAEKPATFCQLEGSDPTTYLSQILEASEGRAVLLDLWATWCGPCMKGMEEMEELKAEMNARGVDFVYLTDDSSPVGDWRDMATKHNGRHYRVASETRKAMGIPGYRDGIPHYVIYDRNHRLVETFTGWGEGSLEKMRDCLEKALGDK